MSPIKLTNLLLLVIAVFLGILALDVGSRLLFSPPNVFATGKIQYKVISVLHMKDVQNEYQKLLDDMSNQGWIFDHVGFGGMAVFRR